MAVGWSGGICSILSSKSVTAATSGMGRRYASLKVMPSFILLCSADMNTSEQQQQETAKIMHINVQDEVLMYV